MRGTSIFTLPGELIGAALGMTRIAKGRPDTSLWWRVRHQYFLWRTDYWAEQAEKDLNASRCKVLRDEHFESVENFLKLP